MLVGALLAAGAACFGQNLPEIAKRDRARAQDRPATHVYTNEDFKRQEILVPSDQQRIEEVRSDPYRKYSHQGSLTRTTPAQIPLADVARHYRWLSEHAESQSPIMVHALPEEPVLASPERTRPARNRATRFPEIGAVRERKASAQRVALQTVRVRRGDSLWKLAAEYLRGGEHWRQILAVNSQIKDGNLIEIGEQIRLPGKVSSSRLGRQFRVSAGDTLWKIARAELGSGRAWRCIVTANPQITNPNRIYTNQVIEIPATCGSAAPQVSNLQLQRPTTTAEK